MDERTISLPLTTAAPAAARRWADSGATPTPDLRQRMTLLISELVANSVLHSGCTSPDEVGVSIRSIPSGVHVEVTDEGVGIGAAPIASEGVSSVGGFGLRLVESVADRWGYTNDPTRVWFELQGGEGGANGHMRLVDEP